MWWRGKFLRILVIFKQTLEVNRIPPVRITSFHHHTVFLCGGDFLSSMNLNGPFLKPFNIGSNSIGNTFKCYWGSRSS